MKSLEDVLVAEWCPTEDGEGPVSIMGLLLQRLEACAPADEGRASACPLQVGTPAASYSLAHKLDLVLGLWTLHRGSATDCTLVQPYWVKDQTVGC